MIGSVINHVMDIDDFSYKDYGSSHAFEYNNSLDYATAAGTEALPEAKEVIDDRDRESLRGVISRA